MPNDAYEYVKMLLNVNKNAKIVIECELHANVHFLALMNAPSRYWSSIHTNECVFSPNEQQKVYCGLSYSNCKFLSLMTFVLYQTASFFHLICNVRSFTSDTLLKKRMEQQISGAHQMELPSPLIS